MCLLKTHHQSYFQKYQIFEHKCQNMCLPYHAKLQLIHLNLIDQLKKLDNVTFELSSYYGKSDLSNSNFSDAILEGVYFNDANFDSANFDI